MEAAATGRGGLRGGAVAVAESRATEATAEAFDLLYAAAAPRLLWQTYLLTAHRHRAAHCVRRAFQLAWTNWDTVSADSSPEGWVRAASFELALSPWHTGGPRMQHLMHLPHRRLRVPEDHGNLTRRDKALMAALMRLPRPQRRALVLHDVIGLDWAQTAVEVEGSTPVTFGRVALARRALAGTVPGIVGPDSEVPGFGRRVGEQLRAAAGRALDGGDPEWQPHLAPAQHTRVRARLHDRGVTAAAGALTLATAGGLAAALIWGTPLHPSEQPFVSHRQPTPADQAVYAPTPRPNQPLTHTIPVTRHEPPDSAGDAVDTGVKASQHTGGGGQGGRSRGDQLQRIHHSAPHAPPHKKHR
ncbi:SigE family RNA polymerase sigma factor [Streptacidiphilus rugosus]|uniref:hypothetical protein n=1 Tax=Streptacidiphilus rugosus TaxID=405783 RepID=UPI0012F7DBB8|nr:hypothetical protein [Streptacidiphilus rugosus]